MKLSEITFIQWMGAVLVVNGAVLGYSNEVADLFGPVWQKHIFSVMTIGSAIVGGFITIFGGIGTQARNVVAAGGQVNVSPLAATALTTLAQDVGEPAIKSTGTIVKVMIVAFVLSALLIPGGASAQQPRFVKPTGNIVQDIAAATGSKTTITGAPVTDIQNFLNAKFLPDLQYALKLATASKNSVTADCYQAWIDIITTQQTAVKNADGTDQAMPDPHVITEFEKLVELRNALQPESPFMIKCSPVASMVKLDIAQFMGVVISGGAGLATLVPGL